MLKLLLRLAGPAIGLLISHSASADIAHGRLEFITPNVTAGTNDSIPIWVRLTLDADSPALSFSNYPLTGFAQSDLPTQGQYYDPSTGTYSLHDFAQSPRVEFNAAQYCSETFTCHFDGTDDYHLNFEIGTDFGGQGLIWNNHFDLGPGQSYDYLFGTFVPKAGGAAPGVYVQTWLDLTLTFSGYDAAGNYISAENRPLIGRTCAGQNAPACSFSLTVVAVPEPSIYAMLALGLAALGFTTRKRKSLNVRTD